MFSTKSGPATLSARIACSVSQYISFLDAGTAEAIADLYAPDATLEDPVGTEPRRGRDDIRSFYSKISSSGIAAELITMRVSGNSAAFHFRVTTTTADQVITIEPIDVMTFDNDGLITSMRAFWSPIDVHTIPL
ncbi:UNVERIFIED_CONTAM: steroid delta-isomerase [Williamsia faeni]